ncbi:MAG: serine hydrolase domain-containing protein [Crocosphaera sp.]|nr:serine hydrolase domain-containing protein [Crocosphaera sp.]
MPKHFHRRQFFNYSKMAFFGLGTSGLALLTNQSFNAQSSSNNTIANLEKRIPQLLRQYRVPGLSLAIVKQGQLWWSRGFGVKNRKKRTSVDHNTVFAAASLSKPLFAHAVLKLVEQGKLDLDTPLTNYTKKPYIKDPRLKLITARMVLSHSTGFPNWSGNAPVWIEATPGTRFGYSGEGYLYLQRVMEEITQEPLHSYIRRQVLIPMGMANSSYIWEPEYQGVATDGHNRSGTPQGMRRPKTALSAGSLRTTARDYAQFLMTMMAEGTVESPLLTANSLQEMLTPQIKLNSTISWGLGWALEKTPQGDFFWHWGDSSTFTSFTFGSRLLKTGIVILTNSKNGLKICEEIVRLGIGGQHPAFRFQLINY